MSYNSGPQIVLDGSQLCPGGEADMGYQVGLNRLSFVLSENMADGTSKSTSHLVA
jgi:predicted naringenin-chalcone synthase